MKINRKKLLLSILSGFLFLLILYFGYESSLRPKTSRMAWVLKENLQPGTKAMVALLTKIKDFEDKISKYGRFGKRHLSANKNIADAQVALHIGTTNKAINLLENLLKNEKLSDEDKKVAQLNLAISYLRLGEQSNCIHRHTGASCIVPIQKEGIHHNPEGSQKAIEMYLNLLEGNPNDYRSRYLLNVAYMTLGNYPEEVPQHWLIPENAFGKDEYTSRFKNIAPTIGLTHTSHAGGAILDDFNNDGYIDIVLSGFLLENQLRYFVNDTTGGFIEQTKQAGLSGIVGGLNLIQGDYNNDGFKDILVPRGAWKGDRGMIPNSLLKNNGDGTFTDETVAAGLLSFRPTQTAVFSDFNNDGWLDIFIGNEHKDSRKNDYPCELFMNKADGTFVEKASSANIEILDFVKGVAAGDFNNDGWMDIYVSCRGGRNKLLRNKGKLKNGAVSFQDVSSSTNTQEPIRSFPTWFWDYDNDGWLDIYVGTLEAFFDDQGSTDYVSRALFGQKIDNSHPTIYRNNGNGGFTKLSGKATINQPVVTMGANFGDFNNDGFEDVYLGTGSPSFESIYPNRLFKNVQGKSFMEVTASAGLGAIQKGHGIAFADIDNDGDQDILAQLGGAYQGDVYQDALFMNPGNDNSWIQIILEGTKSNRDAIGARVMVEIIDKEGIHEIHRTTSSGGSFGSNSLQHEIGLNQADSIKSITIVWPVDQYKQTFTGVEMRKRYRIIEGNNHLREENTNPKPLRKSI